MKDKSMIPSGLTFHPIQRPDTGEELAIKMQLDALQREYMQRAQPFLDRLAEIDRYHPKVTSWVAYPERES